MKEEASCHMWKRNGETETQMDGVSGLEHMVDQWQRQEQSLGPLPSRPCCLSANHTSWVHIYYVVSWYPRLNLVENAVKISFVMVVSYLHLTCFLSEKVRR